MNSVGTNKRKSGKLLINNKNKKQKISCSICFEKKIKEEMISHNICQHIFCNDCLLNYVKIQIKEKISSKILCPYQGCTHYYDTEIILKLLDKDTIKDKYLNILKKEENKTNPNWINCPYYDCFGGTENKIDNYCFCDICKKRYCYLCHRDHEDKCDCSKCGKKSHEGDCQCMLCSFYGSNCKCKKGDINIDGLTIKTCPACRVPTNKLNGCDHIVCAICKYEWCYICKGPYFETHMFEYHMPLTSLIKLQILSGAQSIQYINEKINKIQFYIELLIRIPIRIEAFLIESNSNKIINYGLVKVSDTLDIQRNVVSLNNLKINNNENLFNQNLKYKLRIAVSCHRGSLYLDSNEFSIIKKII